MKIFFACPSYSTRTDFLRVAQDFLRVSSIFLFCSIIRTDKNTFWRLCYVKKTVAGYLENVADFTVDVLNEGICFFLFHQPPFPENARKMKEHKEEEENGKNSRFTN